MGKQIDFKFTEKYEAYNNALLRIVDYTLRTHGKNPRWDKNELIAEAWLALTEASLTFSPQLGMEDIHGNDYDIEKALVGYAKPYIYKRLAEFISINKYTLKIRYYNIKDDPELLQEVNDTESNLRRIKFSHEDRIYQGSDDENIPIASGLTPDNYVARKEELGIIRNIINTELDGRQKKAIILRFKDDLSFREIGKELGVSGESARELVNRAQLKIKFKVKNAGIFNN